MLTEDERKEKQRLAKDWLPRYTGLTGKSLSTSLGQYVILTNFRSYLDEFARIEDVEILGKDKPMQAASAKNIDVTMINFGIGAPNAALICDMLWCGVRGVLFLGKCGGLHDQLNGRNVKIGDYILPTAAVRGEGTSDHYYPKEIPALPSFQLQKEVAPWVDDNGGKCYDGMVFTTNRRMWEHDEKFKAYLRDLRCIGIDMETAAFFIAAFANHLPHGSLLLVSDLPLEKAKTAASDAEVTANHVNTHIRIGRAAMKHIAEKRDSVRHLSW